MMRQLLWLVSVAVVIAGFFAALSSLAAAVSPTAREYLPQVFLLAASSVLISWWARRTQSGASLNPGIILVTSVIVLLPPALVTLTILPSLSGLTFEKRLPWWRYPLTYGHAGLSLSAGSLVYHALAPVGNQSLGAMIPSAVAGLVVHEVIHTVISAAIVAHREDRPITQQLDLVAHRYVNWGTLGLHLLGVLIAADYFYSIYWGLLAHVLLMICVYKAIGSFAQVSHWQQAAWTDGLTGVGNRSAWEAYAAMLKNSTSEPAGTLVVVDVDGLKDLNDRRGHAAGDKALCDLAELLQSSLRKSDRIFRYGGDEFVGFLPHSPGSDGFARERVAHAVERFGRTWSERGIRVSASVGMATLPAEARTLDALFELADSRMYANKAARRAAAEQPG